MLPTRAGIGHYRLSSGFVEIPELDWLAGTREMRSSMTGNSSSIILGSRLGCQIELYTEVYSEYIGL